MHSGLQCGGAPTYSGLHEQIGVPETSLQIEFGPQGEGTQVLIDSGLNSWRMHRINGSPVYEDGQEHIGL